MTEEELRRVLTLSDSLDEALASHLAHAKHDESVRNQLTASMCGIAIEHWQSLRVLMSIGKFTSAIAVSRLQFEALTRAFWSHFAATEHWIGKLSVPLSLEAQKSVGDSPSMSEMLISIERHAPAVASQQIAHFKEVSWKATNSYVHGGIHPIRRFTDGYPAVLLIQVLQNANALSTMIATLIATMSGNGRLTRGMRDIQLNFKECLPPLNLSDAQGGVGASPAADLR